MNNTLIPKILDILVWPDPRLKKIAKAVKDFDKELETIVINMFATMKALDAVGIAAPQVGISKRIICIEIEKGKPIVIINPKVTVLNNSKYEWEEGCLSVPGYFKKRKRPKEIGVVFNDITGEEHTVRFAEIYAFAIQHEVDHLNGICFVDNVSKIWHTKIKNKINKELPVLEKMAAMAKVQLENYKNEETDNA